MKTKSNKAIRELRKIIDQTQGEFAVMIGASKHSIASWETGRKKLSPAMARRIAFATGAKEDELLHGCGPLTTYIPCVGHPPLSAKTVTEYRKSYWGRTDEAAARGHFRNCVDALRVLFVAAARPGRGNIGYRLPGVLDSFIQWCDRTREEFQLDPQIQEQLEQRKRKFAMKRSYGEWRAMQTQDPAVCRAMRFKDDPQKRDDEYLQLEMASVPLWRPGLSMRGPGTDEGGAAGGKE
ncbi:MAG: helix-turn-helix transcriptional regulator [Verrucomicrobia bacterium]|nr:helix-turn-helix transcriptional regulator [Verrucomicrobiota bacterium]